MWNSVLQPDNLRQHTAHFYVVFRQPITGICAVVILMRVAVSAGRKLFERKDCVSSSIEEFSQADSMLRIGRRTLKVFIDSALTIGGQYRDETSPIRQRRVYV